MSGGEELHKCRAVKRMAEDRAHDRETLRKANLGYADVVIRGAKTHGPRVRFAELEEAMGEARRQTPGEHSFGQKTSKDMDTL